MTDAMLPTTPPAPLSEESAKRQRSARAWQRFTKASSAPAPSGASAEARLGVLVAVPLRPAGTTPVTDAMLPTEPPASLSEESAETQRFAEASSAPAPSEASAEARLGALVDVPARPAGTTPVTDAVLPTEPLAPLSEESAEGQRFAEAPSDLGLATPSPSPTPAPMMSAASQRHIDHLSRLYLHGLKVTEKSMPLPARRHAGKWEPGVAPHTVGRDDFSAAAHLLRISHEEFRGTRACRERVGSPRPGLLTADGEMKFIGQHAKRLNNLGREGWFELPAHERLAIFNAYVRKGLPTAPSLHAGGAHDACLE